ncbi:MAG TPA: DNA sulfur modification protein DndB [Solirubrobacteraceae bacterium]|nr:DNA sulfur modification protein DndB [Solirubrobacteraceae bacterium]
MFSDLNRTVHKTSRSLDILYDHRDPLNSLTIAMSDAVPVEKDRPTVAQKSAKVVALSALYDATKMLVGPLKEDAPEEQVAEAEQKAKEYWTAVGDAIPMWQEVVRCELRPAELRAEYICGHAVAFWALGSAGRSLLKVYPDAIS